MSSQESNNSSFDSGDNLFDDDPSEFVRPAASLRDAPDDLELESIFDSPKIVPTMNQKGRKCIKCLHCDGVYNIGHNATKIMCHVCKIKGQSITICPGNISPRYNRAYQAYYKAHMSKKEDRQQRKDEFVNAMRRMDDQCLRTTLERKGLDDGVINLVTNEIRTSVALDSKPAAKPAPLPKSSSNQMTLTGRPYNKDPNCVTIGRNKLARAFFGNGIQFQFINDPEFRSAVEYIATIDPRQWTWCDRHELSGNVLNDLFRTQLNESCDGLKKDAPDFGFCLIGDGATINKVPMINILGQAGGDHPMQLEIVDCSERMASGKGKDAYYLSDLFRRHIVIIGSDFCDLIIFDGARNVQKSGRLLSVHFPMVTCIHDPAHCLHLDFGDIAKLLPVSLMCKFYRRVYHWCQGPHHAFTAACNQCCDASKESGAKLIKLSTIRFGIFIGCFVRLCRNKSPTQTFLSMSGSLKRSSGKKGVPMAMKLLMLQDEY